MLIWYYYYILYWYFGIIIVIFFVIFLSFHTFHALVDECMNYNFVNAWKYKKIVKKNYISLEFQAHKSVVM